jgi:hypothetical protein
MSSQGLSSQDYFRPRGDITTVLDVTDRDSQDNTYFPIDSEHSYFHTESKKLCANAEDFIEM